MANKLENKPELQYIYENDINILPDNNKRKMKKHEIKVKATLRKPSMEEKLEIKEIKRLTKKFISIRKKIDTIENKRLTTIKPRQKQLSNLNDRLRELKIVYGILDQYKIEQDILKDFDNSIYIHEDIINKMAYELNKVTDVTKKSKPIVEQPIKPKSKIIGVIVPASRRSIPIPIPYIQEPNTFSVIVPSRKLDDFKQSKKLKKLNVVELEESIPTKIIDKGITINRKPTPKPKPKQSKKIDIKALVRQTQLDNLKKLKEEEEEAEELQNYIPQPDPKEQYRNRLEKMTISQLQTEAITSGITTPGIANMSKPKLITMLMHIYQKANEDLGADAKRNLKKKLADIRRTS